MLPLLLKSKATPIARLPKRLLPLYIACFFEGLIFWYAIEKVFMVHIGFNTKLITLNVVITFAVGILFNIPSGILADRWSRKGVIICANISLGVASLLLGLSTSPWMYILASVLYGLYYAGYEGTFSAMIYDTVLDENKSREGYEKYYGYTSFIESIALVIASLLGGIIGSKIGLSAAYLLSIPGCLISILALMKFKEPLLHKKIAEEYFGSHLKTSVRHMLQSRNTIWICITIISSMILYEFLSELDQLWPLALHLRLVLYGPLNALLLLGYGLGGVLAGQLIKKFGYIVATSIIGFICTCLLGVHAMPVIAIVQFGILVCFIAIYTVALGKLHDILPAQIRSSATSAVSMLGGTTFIPFVLLFGLLAGQHSVFVAARILIPLAIISSIGILYISYRVLPRND